MNNTHMKDAVEMCVGKTTAEIMTMVCEAKLNGAPQGLIQSLQQMVDLSMEESHALERMEVVMSAWTNYCRTSWIYRLFERLGLR